MSYQQKEKKREDDNQLAKSVKDRCVVIYKKYSGDIDKSKNHFSIARRLRWKHNMVLSPK